MSTNEFEYVERQIKSLGFPERIAEEARHYIASKLPAFNLYYYNETGEDQLMYNLHFSKRPEGYQFSQYELTVKQVPIPDIDIPGINTRELDKKLKEVDGLFDKFLDPETEARMSKQEYDGVIRFISSTNNEVYRLAEYREGEVAALLLMYKYFPRSEYEKFFQGYEEMQKTYEHKRMFPADEGAGISAADAYQLLKNEIRGKELSLLNSPIDGYPLSDEALHQFNVELNKGNHWLAYNTYSYPLEKQDMFFFASREEANEFAQNNISDFDHFRVMNCRPLAPAPAQGISQINSFIQKTDTMNQKNFDYLKDQVKFTGFGDALENELREKIRKQVPEFQLYHNTKFGNDVATATLHFKKSEQSDMYFFNKYDLTLKLESNPDMMKQTFFINKGNNITLKEAYNLMSGRAVNKDLTSKEGQVYNAWVQMDFKETDKNGNYLLKKYHQHYGFDLVKELAKHPIKELNTEQEKTRLIDSLQRGNRQAVTYIKEGNEQRMFIEANPRFKSITIYDNNMQRLNSRQGQNEKQGEGECNTAKQVPKNESQKQIAADDSDEMPKASNKRRKKQSNSIS